MHIDWVRARLRFLGAWRMYLEWDWTAGERWTRNVYEHVLWHCWTGEGWLVEDAKTKHRLEPGATLWTRPGHHYFAEQRGRERLGLAFVHFDLRGGDGRMLRGGGGGGSLPPVALHVRERGFANDAVNRLVRYGEFIVWSSLSKRAFARQYRAGRHPVQRAGHDPRSGSVLPKAQESQIALARQASPEAWTVAATGLLRTLLMEIDAGASVPHLSPRRAGKMVRRDFAAGDLARRIQANPAELPSVPELARQAGLNYRQLFNDFRHQIGMSPQAYTAFARAYQALHRLRVSTQPIHEVARALGCTHKQLFARQFQAVAGCLPSTYRSRAGRAAAEAARREAEGRPVPLSAYDLMGARAPAALKPASAEELETRESKRARNRAAPPSVRARLRRPKKKSAHAKTPRRKGRRS